MSLLQEVQTLNDEYKKINIEYRQAQKDAEKATKKAEKLALKLEEEKKKQENLKEYEKDLTKATENDLQNTFKTYFNNTDLQNAYIKLRLNETREKIIKDIATNDREGDYLQNNYERILQKVYKIFKNDIDAKQELQNIEEQKKQDKNEKKQAVLLTIFYFIKNIIKYVFFIIFGIFYFIWKVLTNLAK